MDLSTHALVSIRKKYSSLIKEAFSLSLILFFSSSPPLQIDLSRRLDCLSDERNCWIIVTNPRLPWLIQNKSSRYRHQSEFPTLLCIVPLSPAPPTPILLYDVHFFLAGSSSTTLVERSSILQQQINHDEICLKPNTFIVLQQMQFTCVSSYRILIIMDIWFVEIMLFSTYNNVGSQ